MQLHAIRTMDNAKRAGFAESRWSRFEFNPGSRAQ